MNFEKSFGYIDPKKSAQWFEHKEGGKFLIAPIGNPKQVEENLKLMSYTDTPEQEMSVHEKKLESCGILARSVLLDWTDVTNEDGTVRPYTSEAGMEILYHFDDFRNWMVEQANSLVKQKEERKEKLLKN